LEERLVLSAVWVPQGPGPILQGQPSGLEQQGNPDVGAVNALVADPHNVNVLYAATTSGGIWKTTDATDANPVWTPLTDNRPNLSIGDIALSPLDANTLYAGTGHFTNGSFGSYGLPNGPEGDGVLKSTDGGNSWSPLLGQPTLTGQNIRAILATAVTSSRGQVVLAGTVADPDGPPSTRGGVYRSFDGGQTWTRIAGAANSGLPDGDVKSLVEDPTNPNIVYAGVTGLGVFQSVDAGQTWQAVNGNIPSDILSATNNVKLAINAGSGTTTLFLLTGAPSSSGTRPAGVSHLFYSTNGGTSWTEMDAVPPLNEDDMEGNNLALSADPNAPTVVWVTGSAADVGGGGRSIVYRGDFSQPSGSQWKVAVWTGANGNPPGGSGNQPTIVHSDGRSLGFDAAGNLLLTNDGGIYKLVNPEGAADQRYWVSVNGTLQDTEFYSVAYDSIDRIVVGGAQDNGMGVQPQAGQIVWNTGFGGDVTHVAVDNSGPTALLYGINGSFVSSGDSQFFRGDFSTAAHNVNIPVKMASAQTPNQIGSGLDASDQAVDGGAYIPFVLDTADPQWLLIGFNGLYFSTDQGDILTDVTPAGVKGQFTALAFGGASGGTANPNAAFAGTSDGQLFVSTNAGTAGTVFNLAETFAKGSVVRSIALDPSDWHTAYIVTTSPDQIGHVWQLVLGNGQAARLTEITGNLDAQASELESVTAVNPAPGVTTLVVGGLGTGSGSVFRSIGAIDGPATRWQLLGSGLPNVNVHDLVYNAADDVLVAGTFGRGAWTLPHASQALLPLAPPAPPSPPNGPSAPTFPASVRNQLLLDALLLPNFSDAQQQASLAQLFDATLVLAVMRSRSETTLLIQQEASVLVDLALGRSDAAIADANALAANPLYYTRLGYALGLIEGELILSSIAANG
jgi:hypothetical protein